METFKFSFKKALNVMKVHQTEGPYIYFILIYFQDIWRHFEIEVESFKKENGFKIQSKVLKSPYLITHSLLIKVTKSKVFNYRNI